MRSASVRALAAGLLLSLALAASSAAQGQSEAEAARAREWFTDLPLVTHEGKRVRFYSDMLEGKVVLITGYYINCDTICPRQNVHLTRLQKMLGDRLGTEVFIVSITVDPKRDTPEEVAKYAKVWKAQPGWTFLTGKQENVDWVNYKLGQYIEDVDAHKGTFILGNMRTGRLVKERPESGAEMLYARIDLLLEDDRRDAR